MSTAILLLVLGLLLVQGCASLNYALEGHLSSISPDDIADIANNGAAFYQHEEQIKYRLDHLLAGRVEEFFVEKFEVHGDGSFRSAIFKAHLSTSKTRADILNDVAAAGDFRLFVLRATDELPTAPSMMTGPAAGVSECLNGGILLPNRTCVCPSFYSGDFCEGMSCLHHGIEDGYSYQCACPPGVYAVNCESRGCLPGVKDNMDISKQSFILVINQRITMDYVLNTMVGKLPGLLADINKLSPNLIQNYIAVNYIVSTNPKNPFSYMQQNYFSSSQAFLDYVASIILVDGDVKQPTNQAISYAQNFSPQMRAFSNIFVFADTPDSEGVAPDNRYSNETVEMTTIMKTIAWRNRIVYILSQRTTAPLDTYGNYYDSFRRIAKATLGDVIVIDILEIDDVVDPLLYYYRQNENVAVRYGMTQDADIDVHSDATQQWVYALLTVEPNGTVPTVSDKNAAVMTPELNGKLWALYRFYAEVSAPLHVAGGTQWNLRVFVESGNTAVVAFATDPMVDVGSASCMAELLPYATMAQIGFTNTATLEMVDLQTGATTAPALSSQTRTQECTFPMQFQPRTTACTPGAFAQQIIFTNSGGEMGRRIVPGFCGVLDHHDQIPYSCLNNGTRTGAKSCDCSNTRFTGRNCGTPVCTNGGTVNKFPGNGNTLCICPFGYKGDFCEILSCDSMSENNLDTFKRTFALVVQNSLSQATFSSSINTGITTMFNLLGQKDAFNDFVLTTFNTIQRNNTPNLVINTEKIPDANSFLSAITSDQLDYKASLATQQDAFKALLSTVRAVDYDKSAIFLFVDTPVTDTVEVNEVVLTAVEKQLEINIVITPPFNMPEKCMGPADSAIYTQITQKTGGNIINLCNPFDDSKNPIVQLFMGYGSTHHHVENLNEAMWMGCNGSMAFFVDDPTTDSFIFLNGELTEKFVASLKNLDDNSTTTLTTFIQTPFLSIYKVPTTHENQNGYLFTASPDPTSQAGVCTVRAVEKTSLTMSLGFTASPSVDLFKRTLYYASPANPVVHISSVFLDEPTVTIDVDDQYSDQYSGVGVRRSSCLYEFFFPKTFRCAPIHDYFIVTVTAKSGNRTIQRAVRAYCYLEEDMCLNGGTMDDDQKVCVCPAFYTGTYCETPICQNNITESNNYCDCGLEYSGRNCEFITCHEWDYLETQDVRTQSFKQITFVLNVNKDQILPNIYLSNQMQAFLAEVWVLDTASILYSLIIFDENKVTNVVSTANTKQFLDAFSAAAKGMVTPTIADSKSMAALYEAYKININPPEIIYLFTGSDPSTDNPTMQAIQRQRVGTQVNIFYTPYNVASPGQVPSPRGYLLTMQARQSGGRVIPMTPNAVSGSDSLLASMLTENALILDDAAKDCSNGVTFSFPAEFDSTRIIVSVTGDSVTAPGNIVVMNILGETMEDRRTILLSDTSSAVYAYSISEESDVWNVTVKTTQGSCFVQVRAESTLHVVPGFTSDKHMDYVESTPFSGYGSSRDVFMTFRVINQNQYVSLTSVDIISSDFSQPWQSPKLLRTQAIRSRDPVSCAYQFVTDGWTMDKDTYQKYIVKGLSREDTPFQRTFFYVMPNANDNATTCQFGTRNTYGECICDGNHVGDFCTDRRCQNGGSPSFGICVCTDGYYGDFCEQYLSNSATTDAPATDVKRSLKPLELQDRK